MPESELRELINNATEYMIKSYEIEIPIKNIRDVVKNLGGFVMQYDEPEYDIMKMRDAFVILAPSSNTSCLRQQYYIAIQIGHLVLHTCYGSNRKMWSELPDGTKPIKWRISINDINTAIKFADALFMPEQLYTEIAAKNSFSTDNNRTKVNMASVAKYFNVPIDAASRRGKFLGYIRK